METIHVRIYNKCLYDWSWPQVEKLWQLSFEYGYMRQLMTSKNERRWRNYESFVCSGPNGPIGWLLLEWRQGANNPNAGIFVNPEYRQNGIAMQLITRAARKYPDNKITVFHWEPASRAFFVKANRLLGNLRLTKLYYYEEVI